MLDRHIFLTGMAGSGKSTLGRAAATHLHLPFLDMDDMIVRAFRMPVTDIFAQYGEDAFRRAETNLLIALTRRSPAIISTGGGTILKDFNRTVMRSSGLILFINRPLESILSDIDMQSRPLLKNGEEAVRKLYQDRIDLYRSTADVQLDNSQDFDVTLKRMEQLIRLRFGLYRLDGGNTSNGNTN